MFKNKKHSTAEAERKIKIHSLTDAKKKNTNAVHTSEYTWWNFVPKNLFEQLRKISNCYFLFNAVTNFMFIFIKNLYIHTYMYFFFFF